MEVLRPASETIQVRGPTEIRPDLYMSEGPQWVPAELAELALAVAIVARVLDATDEHLAVVNEWSTLVRPARYRVQFSGTAASGLAYTTPDGRILLVREMTPFPERVAAYLVKEAAHVRVNRTEGARMTGTGASQAEAEASFRRAHAAREVRCYTVALDYLERRLKQLDPDASEVAELRRLQVDAERGRDRFSRV